MVFADPLQTPREMSKLLATRSKALRLARNWKRTTLAQRSGVTVASLKRFESTGKVSLDNFLRLCDALGRLSEFDGLLQPPPAQSLAELERKAHQPPPKRGRL